MQSYMKQKSLENSILEFQWQTNMIDTRVNMKGKYPKDKYECPHCPKGRQPGGSLETSDHLLACEVYRDLREGSGAGRGGQGNLLKESDSKKDCSRETVE